MPPKRRAQVPGGGRIPAPPRPQRQAARGGHGPGVLRAEGPLDDRQQPGKQVPGGAGFFASPVQLARSLRVIRVCWCSGPRTCSRTGSRSANRSRAAAGSPASPVMRARSARPCRVCGSFGPNTRSSMGSNSAYWSRAAAASPASPGPAARSLRVIRVSPVLRDRKPAQARAAALQAGPGRQRGPPRLPGPVREPVFRRSGYRGAPGRAPAPCVSKTFRWRCRGCGICRSIRGNGQSSHPGAVIGQSRLGVRQQRRAYLPGWAGLCRRGSRPRLARRRPAAIGGGPAWASDRR